MDKEKLIGKLDTKDDFNRESKILKFFLINLLVGF